MEDVSLFAIAINGIFVKNFLLVQFLGLCSFLGVSKETKSAAGMSAAVMFVMIMASIAAFLIYTFLLKPFGLTFLTTISFIIIIASLVQLVEFIIRKFSPPLYRSLGIFLPLITTNCAILGVVILNVRLEYGFIESVFYGFTAGVGYTMVMLIMSSIREKCSVLRIPEAVQGIPHAFFITTLLSMAFVNFFGVIPT
ncbi:MAG: RnfABCDGE type electron transport complex subunit A [Methanosarcinales archaeon]|jgi:electron transport complex protein RnfA|nr:RnfABCDGE type electron transport complex subunit A [Methanosarcinales archaeon]MRG76147.1 RnfABCDGE type electron transport complex subunit A [ANME-2 cluster archaeon]NOR60322.1 RnfABCDGE type electron transport complex subunit A [Methanosarcinales archaeon]